jgi:hypothetical protein
MIYNGKEIPAYFKLNAIGLAHFFEDVFRDMNNWEQLLHTLEKWLATDPASRGADDIFKNFAPAMNTGMENVKQALCRCMLHVARPLRHTGMGPQDAGRMLCEWMELNADMIFKKRYDFFRSEQLREPDERSDQACKLMKNFYATAFMKTISRDTESEYISRLARLPDDVGQKITQHLGPPPDRKSFEELGLEKLWDMLKRENPQFPAK